MELLGNPLVIGLIGAVIAMLFFLVHQKVTESKEETKPVDYFKMALLGFTIGTSSVLLYDLAGETKISLDQDILTGNPDF